MSKCLWLPDILCMIKLNKGILFSPQKDKFWHMLQYRQTVKTSYEGKILINKSQKEKYCMIPLMRYKCEVKYWKGNSGVRLGHSMGILLFAGYRVSVWENEKSLKMDGGDGYITTWM